MVTNLLNPLYFYRIRSWENKISWVRCLGYIFLGYAMTSRFEPLLFFANTLIIAGVFMTAYSLNDYFDYKIEGERNFIGEKLKTGVLTEKRALLYCFIPLIFCILLFFIKNSVSVILAIVFLTITTLYSLPPVRLKRFYGWLYSPLSAVIIFLEAYFLLGRIDLNVVFLSLIVFLFHLYTEMIHILESCQAGEIKALQGKKDALKALVILPVISFISSVFFSFFNPVFLTTSFFSIVRLYSLKKVDFRENFHKLHIDIFSLHYSIYEFLIYAAAGVLAII